MVPVRPLPVLAQVVTSGISLRQITCALFVAAGAVQFWLIEGGEAANAFTYDGGCRGR